MAHVSTAPEEALDGPFLRLERKARDQHLTLLYRGGQISLDVAKGSASNPSDFERALNFGDTSEDFEQDPVGDLEDPHFMGDEPQPEEASEPRVEKQEEPVLELLDDAALASDTGSLELAGDDDPLELA